jgi:hypothetical protein
MAGLLDVVSGTSRADDGVQTRRREVDGAKERVERMDQVSVGRSSGVLIWGVEFGDRVEEWREEVERGSCSLMCTFGLVCGDCNEMQSRTRSVERSRGAAKAMDG